MPEGTAKTERLDLRVTPQVLAWVDANRDTASRSAYVIEVLRQVQAGELIPVQTLTTSVESVSATPAPTSAQTVPALSITHLPAAPVAGPVVVEAAIQEIVEPATDVVAEVVAEQVAEHRHRRGALIDTRWVKGSAIKTYACSTDGCPAVLS